MFPVLAGNGAWLTDFIDGVCERRFGTGMGFNRFHMVPMVVWHFRVEAASAICQGTEMSAWDESIAS